MRISKKNLMRIINEEISLLRESRGSVGDLEEGRFSSLAKAIATPLVPGGRFVSDYTQARGFDELEEFAEAAEDRIANLEQRLATLEAALVGRP
tara:strand:+ start:250 stop:531 length:282 start_codon:yes stop_codon:yes gene_type:complete